MKQAVNTDPINTLDSIPALHLGYYPTPIEELRGLRDHLGGGPRLFVKRDDAITFGFGGNKVRKMELEAKQAITKGADTLITAGAVQSNHARVTAATAARYGLSCLLVVNGERPSKVTANALLDKLYGATVEYVPTREARMPAMLAAAERLREKGRHPYVIPVGASTPLGAIGFVRAVREMVAQIPVPDVIVHATSSGGTQAGLVAGCHLFAPHTQVLGVSAGESSSNVISTVTNLVSKIEVKLNMTNGSVLNHCEVTVDDRFVGNGYGIPTTASKEAIALLARCEALLLGPTYTAKAMAGLIEYVRKERFSESQTVLFWHTGGQVALFA